MNPESYNQQFVQQTNPLLPEIPKTSPGSPSVLAVVDSKAAQDDLLTKKTTADAVQNAVTTQVSQNQGQQTPIQQAAFSATDFQSLLKSNPQAAYYRAYGKEGTPQELADFQKSQTPQDSSTVLNDIKKELSTKPKLPAGAKVDGQIVMDANGAIIGGVGDFDMGAMGDGDPIGTLMNQSDEAFKTYQDQINQIRNGTFPLSVADQAILDATAKKFEQLKQQQLVANKNFEQGTSIISISRGLNRYAPEIALGRLSNAVNTGISKISDIEAQASSTLAQLRQAFEDKNYRMVSETYDRMATYLNEKTKTIQSIQKAAQDYEMDSRRIELDGLRFALDSDKFTFDQKQKAIDNEFALGRIDLDERKLLQEQLNDDRTYRINLANLGIKLKETGQQLLPDGTIVAADGSLVPTTAEIEKARDIRAQVKKLRESGSLDAAVGFSLQKLFPGAKGLGFQPGRAGFEAEMGRLQTLLTMDNLKLLKGAMSDKDLQFLLSAGTSLNTDMSEKDFKLELERIDNIFKKVDIAGTLAEKNQGEVGAIKALMDYYDNSPQGAAQLERLINENPDLTPEDITQILDIPISFNKEGSDSTNATGYLGNFGRITAYGSPVWKPGLDVDLKIGDPVPSPLPGTVTFVGKNGGFGNQVKIKDPNGNEIWLSHLSNFAKGLKKGMQVKAGQLLALGGNTGTVIKGKGGDGSHLDITIKKSNGKYMTAQEVERYIKSLA